MKGWKFSQWNLKGHQGKLKEKWIQVGILDIALLALSVAFLLGMLLFFGPCDLPAEGSWKSCHWAGRVVTGIAGALMVLELLHASLSDSGIRQGLDMGAIIFSALAVLTPGRLIDLCASDTLRCHTAMLPAVRAFAVLIAAVSVADFLLQMGKEVRREIQRRRERRTESAHPSTESGAANREAAEITADGAAKRMEDSAANQEALERMEDGAANREALERMEDGAANQEALERMESGAAAEEIAKETEKGQSVREDETP